MQKAASETVFSRHRPPILENDPETWRRRYPECIGVSRGLSLLRRAPSKFRKWKKWKNRSADRADRFGGEWIASARERRGEHRVAVPLDSIFLEGCEALDKIGRFASPYANE